MKSLHFLNKTARELFGLHISRLLARHVLHLPTTRQYETRLCHGLPNALSSFMALKNERKKVVFLSDATTDTFHAFQNRNCKLFFPHYIKKGQTGFFLVDLVRYVQTSSKTLLSTQLSWQRIRTIEKYSKTPIRPLTLRKLLQANFQTNSAIIRTADWIRNELAIRFAHRLYDFHRLPFFALENPHIKDVYSIYVNTFERLIAVPEIKTMEDEQAFVSLLEEEKHLHDGSVIAMGEGVTQIGHVCNQLNLDSFLKRLFFFRIGRTVMIDHLISLRQPTEGWAGCIDLNCKPARIIEQRAEEIKETCHLSYGLAPRVCLSGNFSAECAFIPHHLSLIVIEILKNAMRATVEFCTIANSMLDATKVGYMIDESDLPPINVEIQKGKSDIIIRISDKGGGIRTNQLGKIWSFGYTTVGNSSRDGSSIFLTPNCAKKDLAGYGFGLPLSRVFARYFGGDVHLQTCFGIGTDVYISLNHIGDQEEAIYFEEHRDLMNTHNLTLSPTSMLSVNPSTNSPTLPSNPLLNRLAY